MPSNRRLRAMVYAAFALVFVIMYLTSDARQARTKDFYEKTVEKMKEKDVESAEIGRKMSESLKDAETVAKDAADGKLPYRPAGADPGQAQMSEQKEDKDAVDGKGRKPVDVGDSQKPWVTVEEPEKEDENEPTQEEREVESELGSILKRSPIIIFSKSYCPFSRKAKDILVGKYQIVPAPFVVELNEHPLGQQLQNALEKTTGRRTVPNILVSGKSIGGGDEIAELDQNGELIQKIRKMAGKRIMEAKVRETT